MYWTAMIRMNPELAEQFALTPAQLKALAEIRKLRAEQAKRRHTYESMFHKGKTFESDMVLAHFIW
jgi:hypothetical protein